MATTSIGVDLGGTKLEGAILEGSTVVARQRIPTEAERGYDHILDRIVDLVNTLRTQADGCERIGIGTPGALSARHGTLKNSNTTCMNGRPLLEDLETRLGLPLRMENDANCFTLAEACLGAARGHGVVFGVILGTGVGGGISFRGELWSGPQHIAGEWGHHVIDPSGPACYCGQRGCVETFLSGPALERAWREASGDPASVPEIVERAESGDDTAGRVLENYLSHFGHALANVIDILDPDAIVLGGGVSNVRALYERGREAVAARVFNDELRTPILQNTLGDSAGVIGAALLGRDPTPRKPSRRAGAAP